MSALKYLTNLITKKARKMMENKIMKIPCVLSKNELNPRKMSESLVFETGDSDEDFEDFIETVSDGEVVSDKGGKVTAEDSVIRP